MLGFIVDLLFSVFHSLVYRYLVESIRKFPDQQTFLGMIQTAGFKMATVTNFTFGVAAVHSGWKFK